MAVTKYGRKKSSRTKKSKKSTSRSPKKRFSIKKFFSKPKPKQRRASKPKPKQRRASKPKPKRASRRKSKYGMRSKYSRYGFGKAGGIGHEGPTSFTQKVYAPYFGSQEPFLNASEWWYPNPGSKGAPIGKGVANYQSPGMLYNN